jgi:hypothetical protein
MRLREREVSAELLFQVAKTLTAGPGVGRGCKVLD